MGSISLVNLVTQGSYVFARTKLSEAITRLLELTFTQLCSS